MAVSQLKSAVSEVLKVDDFRDNLTNFNEELQITPEQLDEQEKIVLKNVKKLVEQIQENDPNLEQTRREVSEAIQAAVGDDPDNKKFNWVVKQLGLDALGLTPPTVETVSPVSATVEQEGETGEEQTEETQQTQAETPKIPENSNLAQFIKGLGLATEMQSATDEKDAKARIVQRILQDPKLASLIRKPEESTNFLSQLTRKVEGAVPKLGKKPDESLPRHYREYLGLSAETLTAKAKEGKEAVEAYIKERVEALVGDTKLKALRECAVVLSENSEDNAELNELLELHRSIPEWVPENDELAINYKSWLKNNGGKESFDYWLNNVRKSEGAFEKFGFMLRQLFHWLKSSFGDILGMLGFEKFKKPDKVERPDEKAIKDRIEELKQKKAKEVKIKEMLDDQALKNKWETVKIKGVYGKLGNSRIPEEVTVRKLNEAFETVEDLEIFLRELLEAAPGSPLAIAREKDLDLSTLKKLVEAQKEGNLSIKEGTKDQLIISQGGAKTLIEPGWNNDAIQDAIDRTFDFNSLKLEGGINGLDIEFEGIGIDEDFNTLMQTLNTSNEEKYREIRTVFLNEHVQYFLNKIRKQNIHSEIGAGSGDLPYTLLQDIAKNKVDIELSKAETWVMGWSGDLIATINGERHHFDNFDTLREILNGDRSRLIS